MALEFNRRRNLYAWFVSAVVACYLSFAVGCGSSSMRSTSSPGNGTTTGSSGGASGTSGGSGTTGGSGGSGTSGGSGGSGSSGSGSSGGSGSGAGSGTGSGQSSAKFLYSSDLSGNRVLGYLVNAATGALTPTPQGAAPAHTGTSRLAADSTGNHLYAINQTSNDLSAYSISRSDGSLVPVPGSPFALGQTPTNVAVAPAGNFIYVTTLTSPSTPTSFIYAFAVQSDGSLTAVPGSPFATVNWAEALEVDPQGKFLYVSSSPETSTASISQVDAFSISADGSLTPVPGTPFTEPNSQFCANGAWDMAIHPSGNFLLLPNLCEGTVIYRIDRTSGALTLVPGSPFAPPGPGFAATGDVQSIAMDPQGTYFWVTDSYCDSGCSMATDTWKLDASTGVATYLSSATGGCGLLARADPSGKFVYEVGNTQNACGSSGTSSGLWGLSVNRANGSLSNVSGSPWQSSNSDSQFTDGLAITP